MTKIGIITMLHNSCNYGGVLQAYALCKEIEKHGAKVEQILYEPSPYNWKSKVYKKLISIQNIILGKKKTQVLEEEFIVRKQKFQQFVNLMVPCSTELYKNNTICKVNNKYDAFVTGSDQVWCNANPVYYLKFAKNSKPCISYAASISREVLSDEQCRCIPKYLKKFRAVTVREKQAVKQLEDLGISASLVCDPTLLLDYSEWKSITSDRIVNEKYIFCYFLGDSIKQREYAQKFAKDKGVVIVTLPDMQGIKRICDDKFGEKRLYNISPSDFLSLVYHAEYILTDSYHAMVFSYIYQKQFVVFDRKVGNQTMSSRTKTLAELTSTQEHVLDFGEEDKLFTMTDLDYSQHNNDIKEFIEKSREFLQNFIDDCCSNN